MKMVNGKGFCKVYIFYGKENVATDTNIAQKVDTMRLQ